MKTKMQTRSSKEQMNRQHACVCVQNSNSVLVGRYRFQSLNIWGVSLYEQVIIYTENESERQHPGRVLWYNQIIRDTQPSLWIFTYFVSMVIFGCPPPQVNKKLKLILKYWGLLWKDLISILWNSLSKVCIIKTSRRICTRES